MASGANWANLKAEAAALERYVEQRLHSSSGGSGGGAGASAPSHSAPADPELGNLDPEAVRLREIDDSLRKFEDVVGRCSAAATASGSSANAAMAQRFRDVLADLRGEQRRQVASARHRAEAAALLSGGREGGIGGGGGDSAEMDMLLRERGTLLASTRTVDEILSTAAAAGSMLRNQGASLTTAAGRLGGFATRLPGVSSLMGAISQRRTRNDTLVSLLIAACVCFSVWWVFLRKT